MLRKPQGWARGEMIDHQANPPRCGAFVLMLYLLGERVQTCLRVPSLDSREGQKGSEGEERVYFAAQMLGF